MSGKGRLSKECAVNGLTAGLGEHGRGAIWAGAAKIAVVEGVAVGRVAGCASSTCLAVSKREEDFVTGLDMGDSGTSLDDDTTTCKQQWLDGSQQTGA